MCSIKSYLIIFSIYFVAAGESFFVEEENEGMNIMSRGAVTWVFTGKEVEKE